jgi:hypothetical protein
MAGGRMGGWRRGRAEAGQRRRTLSCAGLCCVRARWHGSARLRWCVGHATHTHATSARTRTHVSMRLRHVCFPRVQLGGQRSANAVQKHWGSMQKEAGRGGASPKLSGASGGGKVAELLLNPGRDGERWSESDDRLLVHLVDQHGVGGWGEKASAMGGDRTAAAVRSRWNHHLAKQPEAHRTALRAGVGAVARRDRGGGKAGGSSKSGSKAAAAAAAAAAEAEAERTDGGRKRRSTPIAAFLTVGSQVRTSSRKHH